MQANKFRTLYKQFVLFSHLILYLYNLPVLFYITQYYDLTGSLQLNQVYPRMHTSLTFLLERTH